VYRPKTHASYDDPPSYELVIVFDLVAAPYSFNTRGYAEGFVREWWDACVASGDIVETTEGCRLTQKAEATLLVAWRRSLARKSTSQLDDLRMIRYARACGAATCDAIRQTIPRVSESGRWRRERN
jgi:hypothetical protein